MREIKFRAWHDNKLIYDAVSLEGNPTKFFWGGNPGAIWNTEKPTVFMQYTGLKDKNGVEIYEGDIIKYRNNTTLDYCEKGPVVIIWNNERACFDFEDSFNGLFYGMYEVIGNIYQTPELLKPKEEVA